MSKITNEKIQTRDLEGSMNAIYTEWVKVNISLVEFQKKANLVTFARLFEEHGARLWSHFRGNCDYSIHKFLTYLTREQTNELIVNAHENKIFLYA